MTTRLQWRFALTLSIGLLLAGRGLEPAKAHAGDKCTAQCDCAPAETTDPASGCISPTTNGQTGTVSVCGDAASATGCVCVGSQCAGNVGGSPALGCNGPPC
jgi:hypothetical protein